MPQMMLCNKYKKRCKKWRIRSRSRKRTIRHEVIADVIAHLQNTGIINPKILAVFSHSFTNGIDFYTTLLQEKQSRLVFEILNYILVHLVDDKFIVVEFKSLVKTCRDLSISLANLSFVVPVINLFFLIKTSVEA